MFFIGIFGTGYKEKEIGDVVLDQCPHCEGKPTGHAVTRYTYFHLFFIPLYRWNREFAVFCEGCRTWFHLDPDVGHQVEEGALKSLTYWHLKGHEMGRAPAHCKACGAEMPGDYPFCPHCGHRQD